MPASGHGRATGQNQNAPNIVAFTACWPDPLPFLCPLRPTLGLPRGFRREAGEVPAFSTRARKGSPEVWPPLDSARPATSGTAGKATGTRGPWRSCLGRPPDSYLGVLQLQLLFLVFRRLLQCGHLLWGRLAFFLGHQLPPFLQLSLCCCALWLLRLSPLLRAAAGREDAARDTRVLAVVGGGTQSLALCRRGAG